MRAFITGVAGASLTAEERQFLKEAEPWGLIVFARNIGDGAVAAALVEEFRAALGRQAPVLIDQEGGRVQRLRPPLCPSYPPGAAYGAIYDRDRETGLRAAKLGARLMAADLAQFGIDVDCAPIADVPVAGSDPIIGDRAYGTEPAKVAAIGGAIAAGLLEGGVLPVLKHIPGHGRATADSHRAASGGQYRPGDAGSHRFCRISAACRLAAGDDCACCVHSLRPGRPGHQFGHYSEGSDS